MSSNFDVLASQLFDYNEFCLSKNNRAMTLSRI